MSDKRTIVVERAELLFKVSRRVEAFSSCSELAVPSSCCRAVFAACNDDDSITGPTRAGRHAGSDERHRHPELRLRARAARGGVLHRRRRVGGVLGDDRRAAGSDDDLRNHEVIHREFLKAALGSDAIGDARRSTRPTVATTLTTHRRILKNAEMFEDLGVSAYNGAGKYLTSATNLLLAGKIVSVEARHAAAIRDIRDALGTGGHAAEHALRRRRRRQRAGTRRQARAERRAGARRRDRSRDDASHRHAPTTKAATPTRRRRPTP